MKAHVIENNLVINSIEVNSLADLPNLVDGSVGDIGWSYADGVFTPPVDTTTDEERARNLRRQRDVKLSATDWTASTDVTMTAEMTTYRQALRDIPSQAGFPKTITWPEAP
tara:strand:+ start:907 stop:1239 length:333 start_codon:yes stop_codon:yes gene_type:complete